MSGKTACDDDVPTPNHTNPRGLFCPDCGGVRLTVVSSRRPCPGVKIRYRKCSACGVNLTTREVVIKSKIKKLREPEPRT